MKQQKIAALLIKPKLEPEIIYLENTLKKLQELVNGPIELYDFCEDNITIICNEEGNLLGLEENRIIQNELLGFSQPIVGNFLIAGVNKDDFCSLTNEQLRKYTNLFRKKEF